MLFVSGAVVLGASGFLIGLAALVVLAPDSADRFFRAFASSARAHVLEQSLRLLAGAGFVLYAQRMWLPLVFEVFGWVLVSTAAILLLLPWRLHHRFAQRVIPMVICHKRWYAAFSLAMGVFVLAGFVRPLLD